MHQPVPQPNPRLVPDPQCPTKLGASLGIPWEKDYVTMGSVQMRDTIYLAAQLGWNAQGIVKGETIEAQARRAYANIEKLLEKHGAGQARSTGGKL